jgi:hypothetical protein
MLIQEKERTTMLFLPGRNNNFNANSIDLISSKVTLERLNRAREGCTAEMGRQNIRASRAPASAYTKVNIIDYINFPAAPPAVMQKLFEPRFAADATAVEALNF